MSDKRIEYDSMGPVEVDANRLYGAQTQRSFNNFKIGTHKMPIEQIRALALVKKAVALANVKCGVPTMTKEKAALIGRVADEIAAGKLDDEFPLSVFQTGSGTQTNMNVNEVIAHRAAQLDEAVKLHPNDDVNRSQSTNDTFPTAMHVCAYHEIHNRVIPAMDALIGSFEKLIQSAKGLQKVGRTHLQDATFIFVSQELSAFASALKTDREMLIETSNHLLDIPIGGTAVGTGVNTPKGFLDALSEIMPEVLGAPFRVHNNKFEGLSMKNRFIAAHGALRTLATTLFKIANDIRYLASGPRCGYGEYNIPENEPGSSIMPGKVNPTQCEALTMVAAQVIGHDTTMALCDANGQFQLNVFMPIMIYDFVESTRLLSDAMDSFTKHCVEGITFNKKKLEYNVEQSLMIATSLTPYIGYDKAAAVVKEAFKRDCSIKEIILEEKLMTPEEFAKAVQMEGEE